MSGEIRGSQKLIAARIIDKREAIKKYTNIIFSWGLTKAR